MTLAGFIAVGVGAALGAWLRWWLDVVLNPLFPTLPYGTLTANLTGGYLVGVAVAYFGHHTCRRRCDSSPSPASSAA